MPWLSYNSCGFESEAVRCVGVHGVSRSKATPRMHHKFLVACKAPKESNDYPEPPTPFAVWTGSFNPTRNGTMSRENAVCIYSSEVAEGYFKEWYQMLAISEPLNWTSEWCDPEYRFGT